MEINRETILLVEQTFSIMALINNHNLGLSNKKLKHITKIENIKIENEKIILNFDFYSITFDFDVFNDLKKVENELILIEKSNEKFKKSDQLITDYNKNPVICSICKKEPLTFNENQNKYRWCWICNNDLDKVLQWCNELKPSQNK